MNVRYALVKQNGLYLVCNGITTTTDNLLRAVNGSEETASGTSLSVNLLEQF